VKNYSCFVSDQSYTRPEFVTCASKLGGWLPEGEQALLLGIYTASDFLSIITAIPSSQHSSAFSFLNLF